MEDREDCGESSNLTMEERPAWAGAAQRTMEGGGRGTHTENEGQGRGGRSKGSKLSTEGWPDGTRAHRW